MSAPIALPLTRHEASTVALALLYFAHQRAMDIDAAHLLPEATRQEFIADKKADQADAKAIKDRIDQLLGLRPQGGAK